MRGQRGSADSGVEGDSVIPIAQPLLGDAEKQAVLAVMDSGKLVQGREVQAFEEAFAEYLGVKYAIATSSGTSALHLALLAKDIGPGDEVITTPFTFIASANAAIYVGAKPVFVDIDPLTFNISPRLLETAITSRTKAILPVHLYGLSADMDEVMKVAERFGLAVVEDAAQAHGAECRGRKVGSYGVGCFSFYPTKNMTAIEGGMITTDAEEVADRCRVIRNQGARNRYYHEELGFNFRMTDVNAAVGSIQLRKLNRFNEIRIANAASMSKTLRGVVAPFVPDGFKHVFHQYTVRVLDGRRDHVLNRLRELGVGADVYYPVAIHQQKLYKDMGYDQSLPCAERACREVLSLPVHPSVSPDDRERIISVVNELCG